jgi:DNA-binding response OmpR family regulator
MRGNSGDKQTSILIAEDDRISRKLLESNLTSWGFRVITATDGFECLTMFESEKNISMAILDWMMPGMEGPEVCRYIKQNPENPFTYIMMLTALTDKDQIVKALSTGADDYLAKPWNPAELEARIRAGLRIVELESALRGKIVNLQEALEDVEQLKGILPICAWCHKIRDDSDYWQSVEGYLEAHSNTKFTHSICPNCEKNVQISAKI